MALPFTASSTLVPMEIPVQNDGAGLDAPGKVKQVIIEATVIKADGTRIELGKVADSKWNRFFSPGKLLASRRIKKYNAANPVTD